MKKLLSLVLVMMLSISLVACTKEGHMDGMPNPMHEKDTLEILNEESTFSIKACDGAEDESYYMIDCNDYSIAQYKFTYNEVIYTLRAAITEEDISGIYPTDFDGTLGETITDKDVLPTESADGYVWARWYDGDNQYLLSAGDVTLEDFTKVYDLVK